MEQMTIDELKLALNNIIGGNATSKTEHVGCIMRFLEMIPVHDTVTFKRFQLTLFGHTIQNFGNVPENGINVPVFPEFIMTGDVYREKMSKWGDFLSSVIYEFGEKTPPPVPIAAEKLWKRLQRVENKIDQVVALTAFLFGNLVPYYPEASVTLIPQEVAPLGKKLQNDFGRIDRLLRGGVYAGPFDEETQIMQIILGKRDLKEQALLLAFLKSRVYELAVESMAAKMAEMMERHIIGHIE